jgi:hypothetical protein
MNKATVISKVKIPIVIKPHLIGKHPQHEYGLSSSSWQWHTQQQHISLARSLSSSSAASSSAGFSD